MRSYSVGVAISIYLPGAASKETVNLMLSSMILYTLGLLILNKNARPSGVRAGRSTQGKMLAISTRSRVILGFPASSVGRSPGLQAVIPQTAKATMMRTNNNLRIRNLLLIRDQCKMQNTQSK